MDGSPTDTQPAAGRVFANLPAAVLVEHAVRRGEGLLTDSGAFAALTGTRTGRSPKDKYTVRDSVTAGQVDWAANQPMDPAVFDRLHDLFRAYLQNRDLYVFDGAAGADPRYHLPLRVVTERAWHGLFARCMFLRPTAAELAAFVPEWTVLHAADFHPDPARDGTRSDAVVAISFERKVVLVGGTHYAGEIKKAIFSVLNFLLPQRGVFPMHCAANVGRGGDTALFFGLSGTGKTTLSADPERRLIGDDEHGWGDDGVFNFEGGCYAKCIRLDRLNEPEIYGAIRFGTVLENVVIDPHTRECNFADATLTENTRAAYPIEYIPNYVPSGRAGHPKNLIFLTCDAFGVLPPLARLTPEQAMYHFLSGYTAKVAGTERGLGNEPQATFSACFGEPFMVLPPERYADLLGEKLRRHAAGAWLLNTGWTGGEFGKGRRISLPHTRALVDAVLNHRLEGTTFAVDPHFGLSYPTAVDGAPPEILNPRQAWPDRAAYDLRAADLAGRFRKNFERFATVADKIRQAGPRSEA